MTDRPNVILILTDDQGLADLGCSGNPWLRTSHIDALYAESTRFTDFHVQPLCTPTRGALMTGHRPAVNGAWATNWGRSILRREEVTLADVFRTSGYRTGMFGKWHLGDNYPYRPFDRGFEHVVAHKGGGVGQTSDFWGNNYFDDTYFHNGQPVEHTGYCTDVWFDQAMRFIDGLGDEPFFAYIATNAPHSPYLVDEEYAARYRGNEQILHPEFFGMIENIDENVGRLRQFLQQQGLAENTLLMFMTDNGSSGGCEVDEREFVTHGYNAGLRGTKASFYDGGHRAPWMLHWPGGRMNTARDVSEMALDVDLLPTMIDLLGLEDPGVDFDGQSLGGIVRGEQDRLPGERLHFLMNQQGSDIPTIDHSAVLTRRWRLVHGRELYDIQADPGQQRDLAGQQPDVTSRLRNALDAWYAKVTPDMEEFCPIVLGADAENPTQLDAMDVMGDVAWNQGHIAAARRSSGRWNVEFDRPGRYRFSLRRWPDVLPLAIDEPLPRDQADRLAHGQEVDRCGSVSPSSARLVVHAQTHAQPVEAGVSEVSFEVDVDRTDKSVLEAWFEGDGDPRGAYYVTVTRMNGCDGA